MKKNISKRKEASNKVVTNKAWDRNHDYTEEIIQCVKFIILQIKRGWTAEETINQAVSSYKWYVAQGALDAIGRNL